MLEKSCLSMTFGGDARSDIVTEAVDSTSSSGSNRTTRSLRSLISPSDLGADSESSSTRDNIHFLGNADSHKVFPKRMFVFSPASSPSLQARKGLKHNLNIETDCCEGEVPQGSIDPIISPDGKSSVYAAYQYQSKRLSEQIHSDMRRSTLVVLANVFLCYISMFSIILIYQHTSISQSSSSN